MSLDIDHLRSWIGRDHCLDDSATLAPLRALAATLDCDHGPRRTGDAMPALAHWLYFLPTAAQSEIGADGHPRRGGFLPPVPFPRRMWAGSRLQLIAPLRAGQVLKRRSRIDDVRVKKGRNGAMVFVKVQHEIHGDGVLSILEEQDIVYRDVPTDGENTTAPTLAPTHATWERRVVPDNVLLFRFSALTFNGHRIHYDRSYATSAEGYPGLVVHGPLIATLLMDLLQRHLPEAQVKTFQFRAIKPLFDIAPFVVCGSQEDAETVKLWARTEDGELAMAATVTLF